MLSFHKSSNFKKSSVTTLSDFRRIALSMPETEELNGMGYLNFRTARKSFATLEDAIAVIRLTRDQQQFLLPQLLRSLQLIPAVGGGLATPSFGLMWPTKQR
jgi:hypothetical protein